MYYVLGENETGEFEIWEQLSAREAMALQMGPVRASQRGLAREGEARVCGGTGGEATTSK